MDSDLSYHALQLFDTSERQRIQSLRTLHDSNLSSLTDKKQIKDAKRLASECKSQANTDLIKHEEKMTDLIHQRMRQLDKFKNIGGYLYAQSHLDEVKCLYLLLIKQGRWNVRYVKLPKAWVRLGTNAGILEELVVILRTAGNEGLHPNHLFSVYDLQKTIAEYNKKSRMRFLFITKLYEDYTEYEVESILVKLIIGFQEPSFRIGIFQPLPERMYYFYAIQGLYGTIPFDNRVVQYISKDGFEVVNGNVTTSKTSEYAIHFTRKSFAESIWESRKVENSIKKRDKDIQPGSIAKFQRSIHALTCVSMIDNSLVIDETKASIRDRMVYGINDTIKRTKYEAGLVIDVHKLASILPEGCVMVNELGTLLVNDDIPRSCIIDLLITDEQLNKFWRIEK